VKICILTELEVHPRLSGCGMTVEEKVSFVHSSYAKFLNETGKLSSIINTSIKNEEEESK